MDLNLTPVRYKCAMRPWCCAQMLGDAELPREQPSLASLTSELVDSASLGYLRLSAQGSKPCFASKNKNGYPKWVSIFVWRRRKDLNLRAGYPTYTLSRGASSPLEYFSIADRCLGACHSIIPILFSFVKSFLRNNNENVVKKR